ncbi:hypothetical protein [Nocardioides cynanchi]|uniref:hypothetical protein n=1 Tax=Nocardioides cynanchi TaxID=2558918 RepID=UPI001248C0ED|nr:hypothetical protein [Nocardioides cynanchi]
MNSLTDLRTTLDRHAGSVTDEDAVIRTTAVRHRVAAVRRRRRAVGGGALAAVIAATVGVVGLHRAPGGREPVVLGRRVPTTMTSLGYTYRAEGWTRTVAGRGSVHIAASDQPRLLSWTLAGTSSVRLTLPGGDVWTSQASGFGDFVQIPAGQAGDLRIAAGDGSVGVASYALTNAAPVGYTKDGITFRQTVDGAQLLGAVIGDRAQVDASTTFTAPYGRLQVTLSCHGLPRGDAVHVSFNGHERIAGNCNGSDTFDPGAGGGSQFRLPHPGRQVTMRVWASHGVKDPVPLPVGSAPRLRMLAGVYGPLATQALGGYRVGEYVEYDGHLWQVFTRYSSPEGLPLRAPALHRQTVGAMAWHSGAGRTVVSFGAEGMTPEGGSFAGGKGAIGDLWVPAGAAVHARFVRGSGSFAIALYRQVD